MSGNVIDVPFRALPVEPPTAEQIQSRDPVPEHPATPRQLRYLRAVAREAGYDAAALDNRAQQEFGCTVDALSRRNASALIDLIQTEDKQWGTV